MLLMETPHNVSDIHEVVVNAPRFNEGALTAGNNVIHPGSEAQSHCLGNDFGYHVD